MHLSLLLGLALVNLLLEEVKGEKQNHGRIFSTVKTESDVLRFVALKCFRQHLARTLSYFAVLFQKPFNERRNVLHYKLFINL